MKTIIYITFISVGLLCSCNKFLETKPDSSVSNPETFEDLDALLNNEARMNDNYCGLIQTASDDYQLTQTVLDARTVFDRDSYSWQPNPLYLPLNMGENWQSPYETILYANVVLEGLDRISGGDPLKRNRIKGDALFIRAYRFFSLAQAFAPPFNKEGNNRDLGIPLRLSSNVNFKTVRATVKETYDQILGDLKYATELLPEEVAKQTRPNKASAYALLARVSLSMEKYDDALEMANECLERNNTLLDYNDLNLSASFPFSALNPEVIYHGTCSSGASMLSPSRADVAEELYELYDNNDLRKKAFFSIRSLDRIRYKGYYNGGITAYFAGLAVDEIYLIKAECEARVGDFRTGIDILNKLLQKRYIKGTLNPKIALSRMEALEIILSERRKELLFRGLRWSDLRRLNKDPRFERTLERKVHSDDGVKIIATLPPNDPRYTFLIPQSIIEETGIEQNPR